MNEIRILTTEAEVQALAGRLLQKSSVAIDLEMDALHNYHEKICLAQVSTDTETVIIDPLTAELAALAPVFSAPGIRKIFHAGDYDLRCLKRDYGFEVQNLFDTMISAQLCGEEKIGLADLLQKYFGLELDKKYQKADWSQRPLKPEMIRYAAEDTHHLHALADILVARLQKVGRLPWVQEECAWLEKVKFDQNGGPLFLRFKGAGRLERRQLALLEEMLQWRDQEAERRNCPHFKVLGNKSILELVLAESSTLSELMVIKSISCRQVERYGKQLAQCIARARAQDENEWPIFPRPAQTRRDPEAEKRLVKLKQWRLLKAAALELDPGVLINNASLEAIARTQPKTVTALQAISSLRQWQIKVMGSELIAQTRE